MEKETKTSYKKPISDKLSLGIACCRVVNNKPEILLVCKRYTYSYNLFIHGKYNSSNNSELMKLFNGMTVDEKIDILSLNFTQIWYRVWLNYPVTGRYYINKNKFESTFLMDKGNRLKKLISKSTNSSRIWEIPKGRKKNKFEPDIQCAVREFCEETGISKKLYNIVPDVRKTYSFIDDNVRYTNIYYLGIANKVFEPKIDFSLQDQIDEISDIKWMNIEEIKYFDKSGKIAEFVKPLFNIVKKYNKSTIEQKLI